MDALFMAELNERLFTHFTDGAWRAPWSQRLLAVGREGARPFGRIACAGPRDLARAMAALRSNTDPLPDPAALLAALQPEAAALAGLRRLEGFDDPWPARFPPPPPLPGSPLVLLSAADLPLLQLVPLLVGGARHGMIWKPAPGAAASAHLLMRRLGPVAMRRLAMVQGDHATGGALAGMIPPGASLVWASAAEPPEGLPAVRIALPSPDPRGTILT